MPDDALGIDDDSGAVGHSSFALIDTHAIGHTTLGVKVCEQWVRDSTEAGTKVCMHKDTVDAYAQSLGVHAIEFVEPRFQRGQFNTSSGGEVEWVKEQENVLLAPKFG